jgi:hypothetical protein
MFLSNIFSVKKIERTRFQIIIWWELRRILFNLILLTAVYFSLKIIGLNILEIEMGNGEYFIFLILIGLTLVLNFIYSFGWISELFRKRSLTFAPKLFKSLILVSLVIFITLISLFYLILK